MVAWFEHPTFLELVERFWAATTHLEFVTRLTLFRNKVEKWKQYVFGDLANKKSRCWARLVGIQRRLLD